MRRPTCERETQTPAPADYRRKDRCQGRRLHVWDSLFRRGTRLWRSNAELPQKVLEERLAGCQRISKGEPMSEEARTLSNPRPQLPGLQGAPSPQRKTKEFRPYNLWINLSRFPPRMPIVVSVLLGCNVPRLLHVFHSMSPSILRPFLIHVNTGTCQRRSALPLMGLPTLPMRQGSGCILQKGRIILPLGRPISTNKKPGPERYTGTICIPRQGRQCRIYFPLSHLQLLRRKGARLLRAARHG
jgi:hypothetical protein